MAAEIRGINVCETLYYDMCIDFGVAIFDILSPLLFKEHKFLDN